MSYSYSSSSSPTDAQDTSHLIQLLIGNLIPLHVVLAGLTWILHDYFVTLEDEIRYIWPQRLSFSKFMFFWIRYYSIALLLFDVIQIHVFARPGITSNNLCVAMDTIIRVVGAVSLWSVEIIMQLRVYALYSCSKRIAAINLVLFAGSIIGFMWILIYNHSRRASVIAGAIHLGLPGCPSIHSGIEWAQWVPVAVAIPCFPLTAAARCRRGHRPPLPSHQLSSCASHSHCFPPTPAARCRCRPPPALPASPDRSSATAFPLRSSIGYDYYSAAQRSTLRGPAPAPSTRPPLDPASALA
ncbi:hypothetical protein B0H14DRAFT_3882646 [Mycena olivaceomarginata]|nr:hypothetical protein B0H14DRAFT_3882646 [Mycena olivaceomarginata]